jgi:tetratricopeptide (TPR) repeat protein
MSSSSSSSSSSSPAAGGGAAAVPAAASAAAPAGDDFPKHGITLPGILAFIVANGGRQAFVGKTTSMVCAEKLLPSTSSTGLSYCLQHVERTGEVGIATAFVSHAWGYEFLAVIDALEAWEAKRMASGETVPTIFWFDLFSNPQHATAEKTFEWWTGCFRDNIQRIGHTLLVLEWEDPKPLTRAWCVWEAASTAGKQLEVIMSPREAERFEQALVSEFDSLVKQLCAVDLANAQATVPADRERILAAVERTVGTSKTSEIVAGELRNWMLGVGNAAIKRLPSEDRTTSPLLVAVALLLQNQSKLNDADVLFREALEGRRQILGPDHPDTLATLNDYAFLTSHRGELKDAEPLCRAALEGRRRVLGHDHADTLTSLNNLANLLSRLGKAKEAEQSFREALERRKRVLGPDHLDTLASMNDLANLLTRHSQRLDEAEPLYLESMEGRKRVLRPDHPLTLASVNNLAKALAFQGKFDRAEPLYWESLEGRRRVLGADHSSTLSSLDNLAELYRKKGEIEKALPLAQEAYERRVRTLGAENFILSETRHTLGVLLRLLGKPQEALPFARKAYEERRKRLTESHRETRESRLSLARLEGDAEVEAELVAAGVVE